MKILQIKIGYLYFSCFGNPSPTTKKYLGPRSLKQQQQKQIKMYVQHWKNSQDNYPLYQFYQIIQNITFY